MGDVLSSVSASPVLLRLEKIDFKSHMLSLLGVICRFSFSIDRFVLVFVLRENVKIQIPAKMRLILVVYRHTRSQLRNVMDF